MDGHEVRIPFALQGVFDGIECVVRDPERCGTPRVGDQQRRHLALLAARALPQILQRCGVGCGVQGRAERPVDQFGIGGGAEHVGLAQRLQRRTGLVGLAGRQRGQCVFVPSGRRQFARFGAGRQQLQGLVGAIIFAQDAGTQDAGGLRCMLRGFVECFQCARGVAVTVRGVRRGQQCGRTQRGVLCGALQGAVSLDVAALVQGDQSVAQAFLADPPASARQGTERPQQQPPHDADRDPGGDQQRYRADHRGFDAPAVEVDEYVAGIGRQPHEGDREQQDDDKSENQPALVLHRLVPPAVEAAAGAGAAG